MRKLLKIVSIVLGLFTGYLTCVGILGLALGPFGVFAGPLVICVGRYGVTTESVLGYLVCLAVIVGLGTATWALLSLIPARLTSGKKEDVA